MKILHITNSLSEGGVEMFLLELSKRLVKGGHEVTVFVLNKNNIALKEIFEKEGIRIIIGKYRNQYNVLNIILLYKYIASAKWDIIHTHLFPVQLYVALISLIINKMRLITTEHSTYNNRRGKLVFKFIDRFIYKRYQCIVGISEAVTENLVKWLNCSWIREKCITINNGIDINRFQQSNLIDRRRLGIPEDVSVLVMVARFDDSKDQETLIRAVSLLNRDIFLLFVGSGHTMLRCENLAKEMNVKDRVLFLGYRSDISSILEIAEIGILSSHWEGFGLSVVEYMAAGLPVLATNIDGLSSVVGREDLLFRVGNYKELAFKINKLLNNRSYYFDIRNYCLRRATLFSIDRMIKEYVNIYNLISK